MASALTVSRVLVPATSLNEPATIAHANDARAAVGVPTPVPAKILSGHSVGEPEPVSLAFTNHSSVHLAWATQLAPCARSPGHHQVGDGGSSKGDTSDAHDNCLASDETARPTYRDSTAARLPNPAELATKNSTHPMIRKLGPLPIFNVSPERSDTSNCSIRTRSLRAAPLDPAPAFDVAPFVELPKSPVSEVEDYGQGSPDRCSSLSDEEPKQNAPRSAQRWLREEQPKGDLTCSVPADPSNVSPSQPVRYQLVWHNYTPYLIRPPSSVSQALEDDLVFPVFVDGIRVLSQEAFEDLQEGWWKQGTYPSLRFKFKSESESGGDDADDDADDDDDDDWPDTETEDGYETRVPLRFLIEQALSSLTVSSSPLRHTSSPSEEPVVPVNDTVPDERAAPLGALVKNPNYARTSTTPHCLESLQDQREYRGRSPCGILARPTTPAPPPRAGRFTSFKIVRTTSLANKSEILVHEPSSGTLQYPPEVDGDIPNVAAASTPPSSKSSSSHSDIGEVHSYHTNSITLPSPNEVYHTAYNFESNHITSSGVDDPLHNALPPLHFPSLDIPITLPPIDQLLGESSHLHTGFSTMTLPTRASKIMNEEGGYDGDDDEAHNEDSEDDPYVD